jgi:hypothetical protein
MPEVMSSTIALKVEKIFFWWLKKNLLSIFTYLFLCLAQVSITRKKCASPLEYPFRGQI